VQFGWHSFLTIKTATKMKTTTKISFFPHYGYTLVELLIAMTLSLLLLLGVTEMFRHVGSTMNDTQKSLNLSANLNAAALQLRSDLEKIDPNLVHQPFDMADANVTNYTDVGGYFEITEGMNAPYSITSVTGLHVPIKEVAKNLDTAAGVTDLTVGDVDDILAFTAQSDTAYKFHGLIDGEMSEADYAEIIWFVRGTTLYRRVLLVDPTITPNDAKPFYAHYDLSVHDDSGKTTANTMQDLAKRENRFAHGGAFPYPLYEHSDTLTSNRDAWYYLRMPTLEETISTTWSIGQLPPINFTLVDTSKYWDFWQDPLGLAFGLPLDSNSGSLLAYTGSGQHHPRAGEDIVLKNVISFDVKVWNPYFVPLEKNDFAPPQYIDLGQDDFPDKNGNSRKVNYKFNSTILPDHVPSYGYGFTLKGRYNTTDENTGTRRTPIDNFKDKWYYAEQLYDGANNTFWTGSPMPCVFDSWTNKYQQEHTNDANYVRTNPETWHCPPPYTEKLEAIQITIRCFEPQSGHIKQIRVVHKF
jgi:prepilin-type N-terminal cleavage/methylation domain-containing protein